VGSSNNKTSGSEKITFAIAILIRQPPENFFEGFCSSVYLKPRPVKISIAFDSALVYSINSRRSAT
jgi:hypothetical protein